MNFTRRQEEGRILILRLSENAVKLFIWKSVYHKQFNLQHIFMISNEDKALWVQFRLKEFIGKSITAISPGCNDFSVP